MRALPETRCSCSVRAVADASSHRRQNEGSAPSASMSLRSAAPDLGKGRLGALRFFPPRGRAQVGVDIIRIVVPECQSEFYVGLCDRVERLSASRLFAWVGVLRAAASQEERDHHQRCCEDFGTDRKGARKAVSRRAVLRQAIPLPRRITVHQTVRRVWSCNGDLENGKEVAVVVGPKGRVREIQLFGIGDREAFGFQLEMRCESAPRLAGRTRYTRRPC